MLLDTSGLLCFFHQAEIQHQEAVRLFKHAQSRFTHSYVLAEFIALAQVRALPRQLTLNFVAELENSPVLEIVYVNEVLHRKALQLLQSRSDKSWSLCDAVSIVLMDQRGEQEALTTDHHFEQAGKIRLLSP